MSQAIRPIAGHFEVDTRIASNIAAFFEVQSGHRQPICQNFGRHIQRNVLIQPIPTDKHFQTTKVSEFHKTSIPYCKLTAKITKGKTADEQHDYFR